MSETSQADPAPAPAYIDADTWVDPDPDAARRRRWHPFDRRHAYQQLAPDGRRLIFPDQSAAERFVAGLQ